MTFFMIKTFFLFLRYSPRQYSMSEFLCVCVYNRLETAFYSDGEYYLNRFPSEWGIINKTPCTPWRTNQNPLIEECFTGKLHPRKQDGDQSCDCHNLFYVDRFTWNWNCFIQFQEHFGFSHDIFYSLLWLWVIYVTFLLMERNIL